MQIDISFDAAQILNDTTLRQDRPDVWARYLEQRVVRFGRHVGARVYTPMGWQDLSVIRNYLCMWINHQELIPDELRDRSDAQLLAEVRQAVVVFTRVIDQHVNPATRPADVSV